MLQQFIPAFCTLYSLFLQDPTAEAKLATDVRDVTVYPGEALVVRAGKLTLKRGQTRVEIDGLPTELRDDSIRVRANGGASVVGVDIVASQRPESSSASVEELRKARAAKQRERDQNADLIKAQNSLYQFMEALRAEAPKSLGQPMASGQAAVAPSAIFNFISDNLPKILAESRKLQERENQLAAEIAELDHQLSQLQSGRVVPVKKAMIDLIANADSPAEVEISYLIGNAGWSPSYDVRAASSLNSANLMMYGVVTQRTGEDWSKVNLILSTSKPERGAQAPVPQAQYLSALVDELKSVGYANAPTLARKSAERMKDKDQRAGEDEFADSATGGFMPPGAAAAPKPIPVDAQITSSGLSTQLRVPRAEDVPADGRPHRVRIADVSLTLEPLYKSTPKLATRVFVYAKPKNTAGFPILAGAAQVFVANDFVGRSMLPEVPVGEPLELSLGADPGITVERIRDKFEREAPGFLGSRVKWNYTYRIIVKNVSAATGPANIEILENIPVSKDDRIQVEVTKCDPPFVRGDKEDKDRESSGFLRWKLPLAPGESRTITLSYTVSAPESVRLSGLEK